MECPECEYSSSEMGVKVHYGQSHEGSISGYQTSCSHCEKEISVRQKGRLDGNNFCDKKCESNYRSENKSGENHPNFSGGKDRVECEMCSTVVERWSTQIEQQNNVFCSYDCQDKWRSVHKTGKNNPNYSGGVFEHEYGPNWREQRTKAISRANGICEHPGCEKRKTKTGYSLDVHHIVPRRYIEDLSEANRLSNLLVLCRQHHRELEPPLYEEISRES